MIYDGAIKHPMDAAHFFHLVAALARYLCQRLAQFYYRAQAATRKLPLRMR